MSKRCGKKSWGAIKQEMQERDSRTSSYGHKKKLEYVDRKEKEKASLIIHCTDGSHANR